MFGLFDFVEKERNLPVKDEHKHKKVVNNKVIRLHKGRRINIKGEKIILRQRRRIYAQIHRRYQETGRISPIVSVKRT